nr:hypothetical protein [Lachnospiraceae bacterium]
QLNEFVEANLENVTNENFITEQTINEQNLRETVNRENEIENRDRVINETGRIIGRYKKSKDTHTSFEDIEEKTVDNISFVHKTMENEIDEERITDIINTTKKELQTNEVINKTVEVNKTEEVKVKEIINEKIEAETEKLNARINEGVKEQVGVLTDRVYRQIEKKLDNEKKRRGL